MISHSDIVTTTGFHTLTLCQSLQQDFTILPSLWHFEMEVTVKIKRSSRPLLVHCLRQAALWSIRIMLWITECLQFCITTKCSYMVQDEQNIMGDVKVNVNTVLWQVSIYTGGGTTHHRGCERHFVWQVNAPTWCREKRKSWRNCTPKDQWRQRSLFTVTSSSTNQVSVFPLSLSHLFILICLWYYLVSLCL